MSEPVSASRMLLGTSCVITIYDMTDPADAERIMEECFSLIEDLEKRVSFHLDNSEISVLNRERSAVLSKDSLQILEKALTIAEDSDGHFDPTIGKLAELWDIGGDHPKVPGQDEIASVLTGVNYKSIELSGDKVYLRNPESQIDLGGIAKGHAADLVSSMLKSSDVHSAIINLGGNVQLVGEKPDNSQWKIGIQKPDDSRGEYLGILRTGEAAVVTSGIYERFFIQDGIQYHHILDTSSGYPVNNGLQSMTVISDNSTDADGLSTALFAMGMEKAAAYAMSRNDLNIIAVNQDNKVWISPEIRQSFTLTDKSFELVE